MMLIKIEKSNGSKEFGVKCLTGNVVKVVEILKKLNYVVPEIGTELEDQAVVITVGDELESMEVKPDAMDLNR